MTAEAARATLERIRVALALPSREATIHDVKRAVIDEFERIDRRVSIRSTEYFRHSFVPDLVLRWDDQVDRPERWVFLRSKVQPGHLLADVDVVARDQPIIFGLMSANTLAESDQPGTVSDDTATARTLEYRSSATGTLITDPVGLDALSAYDQDSPLASPISSLVSRQIIRGGRGVYDARSSADTASTIKAGFSAAFSIEPEATFEAARSIRRRLGKMSGERLLRLLHAIWVGSGGRSDQFPDAPASGGPLSDDALELLIGGPAIDDFDFWRRLGEMSLAQLGRLNVGDRPPNLGRLVAAVAERLEGRWCRVRPDQARTGASASLAWGIERGALALHGPTFSAYIVEEKSQLAEVEPVVTSGISVETLVDRAARALADVSDVTATGEGLIIGVASDNRTNILENPRTSHSVGAAAGNLTRATATLGNSRVIACDFTTTTVSSRTRGTLSIRELIRHGLPLIWDLQVDEMDWIEEMFAPVAYEVDDDDGQLSLFDSVTEDEVGEP